MKEFSFWIPVVGVVFAAFLFDDFYLMMRRLGLQMMLMLPVVSASVYANVLFFVYLMMQISWAHVLDRMF